MNNVTKNERKSVLMLGIIAAIVLIALVILSFVTPIVKEVDESKYYPETTLTDSPTDTVSDSALLRKNIYMGPFKLKMYEFCDEEYGNLSYKSTMDDIVVFAKYTEEDVSSDKMYGIYKELLGTELTIEQMREKSSLVNVRNGYLNQYKCSYKSFSIDKEKSILFMDVYIDSAFCHLYYGIVYGNAASENSVNNAIMYICDSLTTMTVSSGYTTKSTDDMTAEELEEYNYSVMDEREQAMQGLENVTEGATDEETSTETEDSTNTQYVNDVDDNLSDDSNTDVYTMDGVIELDEDYEDIYVSVRFGAATYDEHDITFIDARGTRYSPMFRGIVPESKMELAVFRITKQKRTTFPFTIETDSEWIYIDSCSGSGDDYEVTSFAGLTYDEFIKQGVLDKPNTYN